MAAAVPPRRHAGAEPGELRGVIRGPRLNPLLIFALLFTALFILHAPLLRLPYFWDEAGYYVPAARDLLLSGSLIPHSTASHAHPPLALAWLALWWKLSGYTPAVTRTAMLLVAAFALLAVFRLARKVANLRVAVAATATDGALPGILCAKFDGARRPSRSRTITMGYSVPRGTFSRWRRPSFSVWRCWPRRRRSWCRSRSALWELWWWVQRRRGRTSRFAPPPARLRG